MKEPNVMCWDFLRISWKWSRSFKLLALWICWLRDYWCWKQNEIKKSVFLFIWPVLVDGFRAQLRLLHLAHSHYTLPNTTLKVGFIVANTKRARLLFYIIYSIIINRNTHIFPTIFPRHFLTKRNHSVTINETAEKNSYKLTVNRA